MKPAISVLFTLFSLCLGAQSNFCDSIFVKACADFITEFSVPDTMAVATKTNMKDHLKKFDEQLNCKFFQQNATPLRARSYTSRYITFGVFELKFKTRDIAANAYQYFRKKHFRDSWGLLDMLSCAIVDKGKILFVYSNDVGSPSMTDFVKRICNLKRSG